MSDPSVTASPWWYRRRGLVIGLIYAAGFGLYGLPARGARPEPAAFVWGSAGGADAGVARLLWSAVACGVIAWLLRASGTAYLRREVVFADDVRHDRLIVAGPFRFVRNPLYLGNLFLAVAVGLMASPVGFAIIVAGNALLVWFLAAEEARMLGRRYGAVYEAFARAVPAFVPRLFPASVPGSVAVTPSVAGGLAGEAGILLIGIAALPLALFGKAGLPAYYGLWISGVVVAYAVNGMLLSKTGTSPRR